MLASHGRALWGILEIIRLGVPGRKVENGQTSTLVIHILMNFFFFFCARKTTEVSETLDTQNFYEHIVNESVENMGFAGQRG